MTQNAAVSAGFEPNNTIEPNNQAVILLLYYETPQEKQGLYRSKHFTAVPENKTHKIVCIV